MKDVLLFADGSRNGLARTRMAADFARLHDARLEVHVVAELPVRPQGEAALALADMLEEARHGARQDADQAAAALRELLPQERFDIETTEATSTDAASLAAVLSRAADLVILGRPIEQDGSALDTEILNGVLFGGGRPCLAIPRWNDARVFGKRALIAYKGTREAARAMHDALPILQRADTVRLLVANPRSELHGEDPLELSRVASHLARHGVAIEEPLVIEGRPEDALLDAIGSFKADLLIMGGYGHSRLRERVFGGVTEAMLRACPIPTLLAH